jgi:hypothetical protein
MTGKSQLALPNMYQNPSERAFFVWQAAPAAIAEKVKRHRPTHSNTSLFRWASCWQIRFVIFCGITGTNFLFDRKLLLDKM